MCAFIQATPCCNSCVMDFVTTASRCLPLLEMPPVFAMCFMEGLPRHCRAGSCEWVCSQNLYRVPSDICTIFKMNPYCSMGRK